MLRINSVGNITPPKSSSLDLSVCTVKDYYTTYDQRLHLMTLDMHMAFHLLGH